MFINKDTISSIKTMTEKERNDPYLIKNRKEFKNSPISVYYGSAKPELAHVCLTCKKHGTCVNASDVERQGKWLKENVNNPFVTAGMNTEEIKKLKQNVFIIINCKFKEK